MTSRPSPWAAAIGGLVLAAAVVAIGALLLRPSSTASVEGVTVACDGIGEVATCAAWARDLLADGPGIHTFDPDDLAQVRLTRPFPIPGDCEIAYYVGRTLDEPVARETVACPDG
jgi:hypothetical protein